MQPVSIRYKEPILNNSVFCRRSVLCVTLQSQVFTVDGKLGHMQNVTLGYLSSTFSIRINDYNLCV